MEHQSRQAALIRSVCAGPHPQPHTHGETAGSAEAQPQQVHKQRGPDFSILKSVQSDNYP